MFFTAQKPLTRHRGRRPQRCQNLKSYCEKFRKSHEWFCDSSLLRLRSFNSITSPTIVTSPEASTQSFPILLFSRAMKGASHTRSSEPQLTCFQNSISFRIYQKHVINSIWKNSICKKVLILFTNLQLQPSGEQLHRSGRYFELRPWRWNLFDTTTWKKTKSLFDTNSNI